MYIHTRTQKLRFISVIQFTAQPRNSCIGTIKGTVSCDEGARTRGHSRQETAWLKLAFPLEIKPLYNSTVRAQHKLFPKQWAKWSGGRNVPSQLAGELEDLHWKIGFCKSRVIALQEQRDGCKPCSEAFLSALPCQTSNLLVGFLRDVIFKARSFLKSSLECNHGDMSQNRVENEER